MICEIRLKWEFFKAFIHSFIHCFCPLRNANEEKTELILEYTFFRRGCCCLFFPADLVFLSKRVEPFSLKERRKEKVGGRRREKERKVRDMQMQTEKSFFFEPLSCPFLSLSRMYFHSCCVLKDFIQYTLSELMKTRVWNQIPVIVSKSLIHFQEKVSRHNSYFAFAQK